MRAYIAPARAFGVEITEFASRAGLYPPESRWARPAWGIWNLAEHLPVALQTQKFDITLLQREMLSTLVTLEPFTRRPRVLDVDDAIWVHRRGDFTRRLARLSDHIICGNAFLAEKFSSWNPNVSVLPTPVDTERFVPATESRTSSPVIGWLGLSSGFQFLYKIESALAEILKRRPDVLLKIVSDRAPKFRFIPVERLQFVPYSRDREVRDIQDMTIGIMPIEDSELSRGKCSFKMLLYMACGIPVVVSPFGMNREVLAWGQSGLGASHSDEWVECLESLLDDREARVRMGGVGRRIVVDHYSIEVLAPAFAQILQSVAA
ncbi:MAG TPA: glycosyltransferase family 4 protein [Terriglobales bacterium]|nr:glycosyltransferase family 4 protein [Terriglobales bacterium]